MVTSSTVAYVDTGGTFCPELVKHILISRGVDEDIELMMQKIRVFQLFSLYDALSVVATLQENVNKQVRVCLCVSELFHFVHIPLFVQVDSYHSNLHLVIIDPLSSLISPLLGGQQTQGEFSLSLSLTFTMICHSLPSIYLLFAIILLSLSLSLSLSLFLNTICPGHSLMCQLAMSLRVLSIEHAIAVMVSSQGLLLLPIDH